MRTLNVPQKVDVFLDITRRALQKLVWSRNKKKRGVPHLCRLYRRSWDRSEKVGTTVGILGFPKHGHAHNTDVMSPTGLSIGQENSDTVSNTAGDAIL